MHVTTKLVMSRSETGIVSRVDCQGKVGGTAWSLRLALGLSAKSSYNKNCICAAAGERNCPSTIRQQSTNQEDSFQLQIHHEAVNSPSRHRNRP